MRLFFGVFKQQINTSKTAAVSMAAALISFGMMLETGEAQTVPVRDVMATEPVNSAIATNPHNDAIGLKPAGDAIAPKPVKSALATNPDNDSTSSKPVSEATPTKPASDAVATKPISDAVAAKQAVAIRRAKLAEHWQEWRYCLAPSQAEHKIYLSTAIPTSKIVGGSDAAFDRMLNTAGIFHDEVQCPRAPNKPTLLFRQRYAIKLNEENGNAVITINWEPDVDSVIADKR